MALGYGVQREKGADDKARGDPLGDLRGLAEQPACASGKGFRV